MIWAKFFLFLLPLLSQAEVSLLLWKPVGYKYEFVIPKKDSEDSKFALKRYLQTLKQNPELRKFAKSFESVGLGNLQEFQPQNLPSVLAIANDSSDLEASPPDVKKVLGPLEKRGAKSFLTPIAVTAGLSKEEAEEFRKKINTHFDALVSLGGEDIHPSLYGDKDPKKLSVHTNLSRDREELDLVRSYLQDGKGMFAGVCRGHQMGGVAASCQLVKDIQEELNLIHPVGQKHQMSLSPEAGKITKNIFDGNNTILVNSFHHQAIEVPKKPNPKIQITAVATDQPNIAEMAEYNGKGISVQNHPELLASSAYHAQFYDTLYGEIDRANARRTSRPFSRIDLEKTLFGVEYTFQDEEMVNEPGRLTWETPHKRERFEKFKAAYLDELGITKKESINKPGFKPGSYIDVPGDGRYVMNMEPVTIEVNTTPKIFREIKPAAEKIFKASENAALVPYVKPAAERSGMGHIHVGARTIGDSPFYKNPNLLRNMMVYIQKHPSLLWGFAEAYDIDGMKIQSGKDLTNIETYHKPEQQKAFARAVNNFDDWYGKTMKEGGDLSDGLRQFLRFLKAEEAPGIDFFDHYRFINLEHLKAIQRSALPVDPELAGKFTVEFRNFRPPKTADHAVAHSELLLAMMEKHSDPNHLEKLEEITKVEYDRFHSATKVAADWEIVKRDLQRYNEIWDDSVGEYVQTQLSHDAIRAKLPKNMVAEIYPAYSPKIEKGTKFEMRLPVTSYEAPKIQLDKTPLKFEKVSVEGKEFWVTTFSAKKSGNGLTVEAVTNFHKPNECKKWFSLLK
jgi:putative glutamine amidotransferase